jgi:hypothetical protein
MSSRDTWTQWLVGECGISHWGGIVMDVQQHGLTLCYRIRLCETPFQESDFLFAARNVMPYRHYRPAERPDVKPARLDSQRFGIDNVDTVSMSILSDKFRKMFLLLAQQSAQCSLVQSSTLDPLYIRYQVVHALNPNDDNEDEQITESNYAEHRGDLDGIRFGCETLRPGDWIRLVNSDINGSSVGVFELHRIQRRQPCSVQGKGSISWCF